MASPERFIGLMSGTSLDGVDAVMMEFSEAGHRVVAELFVPYDEALRTRLLGLHDPLAGEIHEASVVANLLSHIYAGATLKLLETTRGTARDVRAIGCHGQTIRHRPEAGYTIQLGNGALLAELTGITVVSDFRSRDIAAGGEGAPLVSAFHGALFAHPSVHRVIVNIGGIANLTDLPASGVITGFDTGPGNLLLDAWIQRHSGMPLDHEGAWAKSGQPLDSLLKALLAHEFFLRRPPKSTGRDVFSLPWLDRHLTGTEKPEDVQATLLALTVSSIENSIRSYCGNAEEVYLCGGGAHNMALVENLRKSLAGISLATTDGLGIGADWVEACAFAWLAYQALHGCTGNLPQVTGAKGPRILGAIYQT